MDPEPDDRQDADASSSTVSEKTDELTASRQEYEGPHMIHLRQALQKTRKKCIDSLKYNTFARKYKFAHEAAPHVLRNILAEFRDQLDNMIKGELEEMIAQENLVPLFNNLDELIKDGSMEDGTPAWRPSGVPQSDVQDHLYKVKLEEKEKLQKLLEATEQETERLKELVDRKKQHLSNTQNKIEEHLNFFEKSAESCRQFPVKEIELFQMELDQQT
ncbi:Polyamine-modulated factor 1 [Holothuria leucospilota]|uniref:Polyamine-modulated factor 1 n=1 Tax=Holothuria leucospilota TaxID=206669 RepID=A0A9Q1H1D4_HOLLE|nr:Polyamine-modulated factor 1 [Holothuria leucospilota]